MINSAILKNRGRNEYYFHKLIRKIRNAHTKKQLKDFIIDAGFVSRADFEMIEKEFEKKSKNGNDCRDNLKKERRLNKSMKQKYFIRIAVLIFILIGFYFIYSYFFLPGDDRQISQEQINRNTESILENLNTFGNLSEIDAKNGFWYATPDEFEGESIFYFSLLDAAKRNLSGKQLADFYERVKKSRIVQRDGMRFVREEELPSRLQFHNGIYSPSSRVDSNEVKARLENKLAKSDYISDELWEMEYLSGLEGDYKKRDKFAERNCVEFKERCDNENIDIKIIGKVADGKDNPIQSAKIEILGKEDAGFASTDSGGLFELLVAVKEMEKIRIKASKRNFSDGVFSFIVLNKNKKEYLSEKIVLESPIEIVTLNSALGTVTGKKNSIRNRDAFIIKTSQSIYEIPFNSLLKPDGSVYSGEADVYLYEFTKETMPDSLRAVDTFDQVIGYAGNLMETFGMPYIQFFTPEGIELQVKKNNPINLKYRIFHMKDLFEDSYGTHKPLTKDDMKLLVEISKQRNGYPIDREFIINTKLLNFPAWWIFDRESGVWNNEGMRVLDEDGLIETIFYTIRG